MESKLAENVRIKLTHWAALNQYEFLFEAFSVNNFSEPTDFYEQNKFNLRKSILMLKLAMKESESCDNYNFENLIVSFDEFEKWCGVTDSFNGQEYYFQLIRRCISFQIYAGVLSRHLGWQSSEVKLMSPTKQFCSVIVHAQTYIDEITKLFEERETKESLFEEQPSHQEIRDLDRCSDFKLFVEDVLVRDEDGDPSSKKFLIDPPKALCVLHRYDLENFLQKLTSLIKQFELQELPDLSIKFSENECSNPAYRPVRNALFREDDGYDSAQERVLKSFMNEESPQNKRKVKVVSPNALKVIKETPLGLRRVYNRFKKVPPKVRQKWTEDETKYLLIGLERYGMGNHANIIDDKELHPYLKCRDNIMVKDKVRNLLLKGVITIE